MESAKKKCTEHHGSDSTFQIPTGAKIWSSNRIPYSSKKKNKKKNDLSYLILIH